jgi:hypothetical protein
MRREGVELRAQQTVMSESYPGTLVENENKNAATLRRGI